MGQKVDEFCNNLRDRLNRVEAKLDHVKASVDKAGNDTQAAITAKLDEAKSKVEQSKRDAERAQAKVSAYLDEKKAETAAKIEDWKRERQLKKLDSRAEKAEDYAVSSVAFAVVAIEQAELATLEAIASRIDAEEARSTA